MRRLDDAAPELLGAVEGCLDVFDADEERDRVGIALQRADRGRERALGAAPAVTVAGGSDLFGKTTNAGI